MNRAIAMFSIGHQVGRYRLEAKLGEGGMGVVYRATDLELDRIVALKIVRPELSGNPEWRKRFSHEARAAARFDHPNIVKVHEVGCEHGLDYICMEYLEGETLDQKLARRPLGMRAALGHAVSIAGAISAAHGAGVVHRDLKPANVFLTADGGLKLLDFGLAKFTEESAPSDATRTLSTQIGQVLGTVSYMSPEQAEGRAVDTRSDIFSFGAVLYEMITNQRAFAGESSLATMAAILRDQPSPASKVVPSISPALDRLIDKCLQKQPGRRFSSMSELKAALEAEARAEGIRRIPWSLRRWTTWAILAVTLASAFALMSWGSSRVKLADIYLVCFLVSFAFSVVAAFSGSLHLHHAHIGSLHDMSTGDFTNDSGTRGSASMSPVNAGSVAAFLVWFGGAGYILAGHFAQSLAVTFPIACASGAVGAALLFAFLSKVLLAHDVPLNPADYEMAGVKGRLTGAIREGGTGEMIFSQAGTRRAIGVRSATGTPIARDQKVIVVRCEKGIAYVRELAE